MADHTASSSASEATGAERRRHRRLPTEGVRSLLGEVLDISPGGMRIRHAGPATFEINDAFDVVIWQGEREVMTTVRVAWTAPRHDEQIELGLEFVGGAGDLRGQIDELARHGCGRFDGPQCWVAA